MDYLVKLMIFIAISFFGIITYGELRIISTSLQNIDFELREQRLNKVK